MTFGIAPKIGAISLCYNRLMKIDDVKNAQRAYKDAILRNIGIAIGVFLIILLSCLVGSGSEVILFFFPFFAMVILIIFVASAQKQSKAYHKAYKGYFVQRSLANVFTDLVYEREEGISSEFLRSTGMINTGDRYSSNDYVHGKYKDVGFTQSDVQVEVKHTDSDGKTTYYTIFRGRFMDFEFPKSFSFRLEVAEKGFGANLIPYGKTKKGRKFEKVSLESSEFNETFRTYAEDGFEAFYILDPALMNNMLELSEKHKGKLLFCFCDNHLIVGLKDGKDAFEPPSAFKTIDEAAETKKVTSEINLVTDFVDQLKLNRKIFK